MVTIFVFMMLNDDVLQAAAQKLQSEKVFGAIGD